MAANFDSNGIFLKDNINKTMPNENISTFSDIILFEYKSNYSGDLY